MANGMCGCCGAKSSEQRLLLRTGCLILASPRLRLPHFLPSRPCHCTCQYDAGDRQYQKIRYILCVSGPCRSHPVLLFFAFLFATVRRLSVFPFASVRGLSVFLSFVIRLPLAVLSFVIGVFASARGVSFIIR